MKSAGALQLGTKLLQVHSVHVCFPVQLPARKVLSGLLMATLCMKVEWRSAITTYGALSVMTLLQGLIVLLSAGSLALVIQVITVAVCWLVT